MLPSLKVIKAGLQRTTEALAAELARPGRRMPSWSALEWQLAAAAAAAHGVSPLLCASCSWDNPPWRSFLAAQREHVAHRYRRMAALLEQVDSGARARSLPIVPLKGSALHALEVYLPGERPMADIDLLVREADAPCAIALLEGLGYVRWFTTWNHHVLKPAHSPAISGLGEHRDRQITIELHTHVRERLPISSVDITERIYPSRPHPGLNPYPSIGALMSHLLLHTAGNMLSRSVRLLHLNDIARLGARMTDGDWSALWGAGGAAPWWALPPVRLTTRYFRDAIPASLLGRLGTECPALLRMISRNQTLTDVSCSALWIQALGGIEWSRSICEASRFIRNRIIPDAATVAERATVMQTMSWMQGPGGARLKRGRVMLARLTGPVPRTDSLHVISAALAHTAQDHAGEERPCSATSS